MQIPKTYLVGGNGYTLPIIEIAEGTQFKGYSLPEIKIQLRNGTWQEPVNYDNLTFTGFMGDAFNNKDFGAPSVFLTFDASDFAPGAQVNPVSVSGVKLNGIEVAQNKLVLWEANRLWIQYTAEDVVANVNGYISLQPRRCLFQQKVLISKLQKISWYISVKKSN